MSLKQKIIGFLIALGLILVSIFSFGLYPKTVSAPVNQPSQVQPDNSGVKVVSGNISLNQVSTVSPTQDLEVTFNKPMVQDNTRISLDPAVGYRTELSSDHKTIKIIPDKSLNLGKSYTLTIKSGYQTDTQEHLDSDQVFHFQTISYKGV